MGILTTIFGKGNQVTPEVRLLHSLTIMLAGLDGILGVDRVQRLSYGDAVRWFVHNQPRSAEPLRGALIRRPDPCGHQVIWLFLNEGNAPVTGAQGEPHGRKAIVAELDEELTDCFGDQELLIFA